MSLERAVSLARRGDLPIAPLLKDIAEALCRHNSLILKAPPGAGKTTIVPLALFDASWRQGGKILMLEPRRLAARAAAMRLAASLGQEAGGDIGYRIRGEARPGRAIDVVTDGILTRMIQNDPALEGVAAILFDEVHERGLESDLALALALECQGALRDDLRLIAMSATLEHVPLHRILADAPVLESQGRQYPVDTRYLPRPSRRDVPEKLAETALMALREHDSGDILAFLPGAGEIRRAETWLKPRLGAEVRVCPLYGDMDMAAQRAALRPAGKGQRRIVLATAIAQSSLTIDGVCIVIDGGLSRGPVYDPGSGMTRLETRPVSRDEAEQRRGRAGRQGPGICYRLWPRAAHGALPARQPPEILIADLSALALELAIWGVRDPAQLPLVDPPPPASFAAARDLLQALQALDAAGAVTEHGKRMAALGMAPRLAHMVLMAAGEGADALTTAAWLAALLGERDPLRMKADGADMALRLAVAAGGRDIPKTVHREVRRILKRLKADKTLSISNDGQGRICPELAGRLLARAWPERVAHRRGRDRERTTYRLANGKGAWIGNEDPLSESPFLAIAELGDKGADAMIRLASALEEADIETLFAGRIGEDVAIRYDPAADKITGHARRVLGHLVVKKHRLARVDDDRAIPALIDAIRARGIHCLKFSPAENMFRARIRWAAGRQDAPWPDLGDEALLAELENWLAPALGGCRSLKEVAALDKLPLLEALLPWDLRRLLDEIAPAAIVLPDGRKAGIDYMQGERPVLAVRLQDMFGMRETPAIDRGREKLLLHLLSPARRPLAVTDDLLRFWQGAYADVRKEMRGRYPRHAWPEDPLQKQKR